MTDDSSAIPTAFVQDVTAAESVVVMKVRVPGRTSTVVVGDAGGADAPRGAGLLTAEARERHWGGKLPAGLPRIKAREESLLRSRLIALTDDAAILERDGLLHALRARGGRVVVTDDAPRDHHPFSLLADDERLRLQARGEAIAAALAAGVVGQRRELLRRVLDKAEAKMARRAVAIAADLSRIEDADRLAAQASWLLTEAKRTPRGARALSVTDWSSGEPVPLVVPLDPAKGAFEQVEAMFKRAKRLRLGARVAEERRSETERLRTAMSDARRRLDDAKGLPELEAVIAEAKRTAPRDVVMPSGASAGRPSPLGVRLAGRRVPFRTFRSAGGQRILVGKGASDNDVLTMKVARPHDLWLHAKDHQGAHVIVPLDKGHGCPAEDLVEAAHLAAHFSDARDEATVDVQYTPRRYLRKPKGAAPGLVIPTREKVMALRVDAGLRRALLEREEV